MDKSVSGQPNPTNSSKHQKLKVFTRAYVARFLHFATPNTEICRDTTHGLSIIYNLV